MIHGPNIVLRIMTPPEAVAHLHHANDPRGRTDRDFVFTSHAAGMERFATNTWLSEEEAVLALDLPDRPHAGFVQWYMANPAVSNLEIDVGFYRNEDDTGDRRAEAYGLTCRYLFQDRPVRRIQLLLLPEDSVGRRAARKAGFAPEGTLRHMTFVRGHWHDLMLWSVLREALTHA